MSDYITLLGAEDVQRAGNNISTAAETMSRAAASIEDSLFRHRQFLDDFLLRVENIIKNEGV